MDTATMRRTAERILQARDSKQPIDPPSEYIVPFDLSDGYRIGQCLHQSLVTRGFISVGRKIGFTNKVTWRDNLKTPIWAYMYDRTVIHASNNSAEISLGSMISPRLEPEIVFKLRKNINKCEQEAVNLLDAIEWIAMGFEIVDCHYSSWKFTAPDAVADFGVHAKLIVSLPLMVLDQNPNVLEGQLRNCRVTLRKRDEIFAHGRVENALGSPILALNHLISIIENQS